MRTIHPPVSGKRLSADCAEALEPAFAQLVERAQFVGWSSDEVLRALCLLTWRSAGELAPDAEAERSRGAARTARA